MAVDDTGKAGSGVAHVFMSNVLSGVITRFDITYTPGNLSATATVLASGFNHRTDPAALVLGPSGLAYDSVHNVLLVASSTDNAIYQIPNAATATATESATLMFQDSAHLHGPLDLAILRTATCSSRTATVLTRIRISRANSSNSTGQGGFLARCRSPG